MAQQKFSSSKQSCSVGTIAAVMHNLLPGSFVLPLQDVLKLLKRGSPVEMDFLSPLVEIGDGFVDGEFDAKSTTVDVDFCFQFVETRVLVLHFVCFLR